MYSEFSPLRLVYMCLLCVANRIINVKNNEHVGIANENLNELRDFTKDSLLEQSHVFTCLCICASATYDSA